MKRITDYTFILFISDFDFAEIDLNINEAAHQGVNPQCPVTVLLC